MLASPVLSARGQYDGDIPVFSVRTDPGAGLPVTPGRVTVQLELTVPPVTGAFVTGVQVDGGASGQPVTASRSRDVRVHPTHERPYDPRLLAFFCEAAGIEVLEERLRATQGDLPAVRQSYAQPFAQLCPPDEVDVVTRAR